MKPTKPSAAGMKLLHRLADNPVTSLGEHDGLVTAAQNLLDAHYVAAWGIQGGWRWQIYEVGWKALGASPETIRSKLKEQAEFGRAWVLAIEARTGFSPQADLFGRAA